MHPSSAALWSDPKYPSGTLMPPDVRWSGGGGEGRLLLVESNENLFNKHTHNHVNAFLDPSRDNLWKVFIFTILCQISLKNVNLFLQLYFSVPLIALNMNTNFFSNFIGGNMAVVSVCIFSTSIRDWTFFIFIHHFMLKNIPPFCPLNCFLINVFLLHYMSSFFSSRYSYRPVFFFNLCGQHLVLCLERLSLLQYYSHSHLIISCWLIL